MAGVPRKRSALTSPERPKQQRSVPRHQSHTMFTVGEFVPEMLRLWEEWDWSVDSLLPFEYGPSSGETAEGCGRWM